MSNHTQTDRNRSAYHQPLRRVVNVASRCVWQFYRLWFSLTPSEQRAVVVIVALAIVGLLVRSWRIAHGDL